MSKDKDWLKGQLTSILGWDPSVTEGVVEAIAGASSQAEIDEYVNVRGLWILVSPILVMLFCHQILTPSHCEDATLFAGLSYHLLCRTTWAEGQMSRS